MIFLLLRLIYILRDLAVLFFHIILHPLLYNITCISQGHLFKGLVLIPALNGPWFHWKIWDCIYSVDHKFTLQDNLSFETASVEALLSQQNGNKTIWNAKPLTLCLQESFLPLGWDLHIACSHHCFQEGTSPGISP